MKFFTAATAALLAFATIASAAPEAAEAVAQDVKRSCTPAPDGCVCNKIQGQFCGIQSPCKVGYVYECNGQSGNACEYGPRDSCKKCNKLKCP